jgi:hypothetical protein
MAAGAVCCFGAAVAVLRRLAAGFVVAAWQVVGRLSGQSTARAEQSTAEHRMVRKEDAQHTAHSIFARIVARLGARLHVPIDCNRTATANSCVLFQS